MQMTNKLVCKKDQLQDVSTALSTYEDPTNCTSALKTTELKRNYGKDCLKEAVLNLTLAIFSLVLPLRCLVTAAKDRLHDIHSAQVWLMQTLTYTQLSGLV